LYPTIHESTVPRRCARFLRKVVLIAMFARTALFRSGTSTLWTATASLLVALATFVLSINQVALGGCQTFTLAETLEQIAPHPLARAWQNAFGPGIVQGRSVSVLLAALTFACIYRLTADLTGKHQATRTIVIAGLVSVSLSFWGWTMLSGWLSSAVPFSMLLIC